MPGASPSADLALMAALKWEASTRQSLIDGTPISKPPRSKSYSDSELLDAVRVSGSNTTDPLVILREKIAALGEEAAEPLHDKITMIEVAAKKTAFLTIKPVGLEGLSDEQNLVLSRAVSEGNVPDSLLNDPSLSEEVRLAVARAIPEHIWTDAVAFDQHYGVPGDPSDTEETV